MRVVIAGAGNVGRSIARELLEEMGIRVEVGPHLVTVRHAYTHFTIDLHAHFARIRSGRPRHLDCAGHACRHCVPPRDLPCRWRPQRLACR